MQQSGSNVSEKTHNGAEGKRKGKKIEFAYEISRAVSKPYSCTHTPIMYSGRTVVLGYFTAELTLRCV